MKANYENVGESCDVVTRPHPAAWTTVTAAMLAKMLGEFSHEQLLKPQPAGNGDDGLYRLCSDDGASVYRFRARRGTLDHWDVDPSSIAYCRYGQPRALNAVAFVCEMRDQLGLSPQALPAYVEEMSAVLAADSYKHVHERLTAEQLAYASFQEVEASMTQGHPCFVVNSARLGFDANDYLRFAPETGTSLRLVWLAASRERAAFSCAADIEYETFVDQELGCSTRREFELKISDLGQDPNNYVLIPVHPWQWRNRLCQLMAGDLARGDLIVVGVSEDLYQPQQSIRTLFNVTTPGRCYVKTALGIVNMGFVRGLSPYYMEATPAINDWVADLVSGDPTLRQCGFKVLREVAAIGYRSPTFERAGPRSSPHNKMLAALWRENPQEQIETGQQLATMAALLHRDREGRSYLQALIARSRLSAQQWLRQYLKAYLRPLLHCYFAFDLAFMPHGENVILVLAEGVPQRVFIKDIAEEVCVFENHDVLPQAVRRIGVDTEKEARSQVFFMDVFDCFFRFLASIFDRDCGLPQRSFWQLVSQTVRTYQTEHPHLSARFADTDLFSPQFRLSCCNRLQLRNARQMVSVTNPWESLLFAGSLDNPLVTLR